MNILFVLLLCIFMVAIVAATATVAFASASRTTPEHYVARACIGRFGRMKMFVLSSSCRFVIFFFFFFFLLSHMPHVVGFLRRLESYVDDCTYVLPIVEALLTLIPHTHTGTLHANSVKFRSEKTEIHREKSPNIGIEITYSLLTRTENTHTHTHPNSGGPKKK